MCPCVRIDFLLNTRSSHTGVPVHVSGVPVLSLFCSGVPIHVEGVPVHVSGVPILSLFCSSVPVHVEGVPVHFAYCHFSAQVYRYTLKV